MSFSLVSFLCLGGRLFDFCQVLHDYNVFVRFKYIVAYFVYKIFVDVRSLFLIFFSFLLAFFVPFD